MNNSLHAASNQVCKTRKLLLHNIPYTQKKKIIDAISCQEPALNTQKSLQKQRCFKSGVVFSIHPAIINLCDTTSTHDAPAVDKKH